MKPHIKFPESTGKHGYKDCSSCKGTGKVKRYPYYATVMPEMVDEPCEDCKGRGQIFVVPNNCVVVREPNSEPNSNPYL
jgi:DnaJ-class molecular chaperone